MSIYINRNGQQSGPYDDEVVVDRLRTGRLSADDLAIRHGGTAWKRLGDMFPGVAGGVSSTPPSQQPVSMTADPSSKGGCRKAFGWAVLVFGLLLMLGCAGAAIVNRTLDHTLCQNADRYSREVDEAKRDLDAAKGTVREAEALRKYKDKITSLEVSTESCGDMLDYYQWWFFAFIGAAILGFFFAIVGFFIRRV